MKIIALIAVAASSLFFYSCSHNEEPKDPQPDGFDKSAMLIFYADSLIIPNYLNLSARLDELEQSSNNFSNNPTGGNQDKLHAVYTKAYLQFEHISVNQFGPAEKVLLNNFLNTFPANKVQIELNVQNGVYDLTSNFALNQQGFPALDYLLFEPDALVHFTAEKKENRKKYIADLIARMKLLVSGVSDAWRNSYRSEYINNTRMDAGSPLGLMINQFALEMDQMKGPRIGWPFGKQSGGVKYPENTEGYYANISASLALENLKSLKTMYNGNGSGKSFSDYLIALNKQQLNTDILNQFESAVKALTAVPDPLSKALVNNTAELDTAYREIQLLLTLIKTDLASALGVRITYQDTDGD